MEILVLNTKFEAVAVVDTFKSLIWTDRYNACGDFEIYLAMENRLLDFLRKDYYLWSQDSEHCMIIEDLSIESDAENGNYLTVTGRSLESILDRRIVWGQKVLEGSLQDAVKTLLDESVISPAVAERKIENFVFEASEDEKVTAATVNVQFTGEDLYKAIQSMCAEHDIGFKVVLNQQNQFVFSLYAGLDRSYAQSANPYVIFSPNFENIINSNYYESKANYKNVTLVAGEGEGAARRTATVGEASGMDRREIFTDARDISSTVDGGTVPAAQYDELLKTRGKKNLKDYVEKIAFEGEVESTRLFKYGEDFFIGDIVQIVNEYGHEGSAYISELVISQSEDGTSVYPTFEMIQKEEAEETV